MKTLLVLVLTLALVGSAVAFDLGNQRPAKPADHSVYNAPAGEKQGGDTLMDATPITLPYAGTGTTAGYFNDYDEVCPYTGSTAPDVVYTFTATMDMAIKVDLWGSSYDTKTYVYDENLVLLGCNDDYYDDWTSLLENVPVMAGVQYFVVIDGYGSGSGAYAVVIDEYIPCDLECPVGAVLEGEPPLVDLYEDYHNGGCNSSDLGVTPFQPITSEIFCGTGGWYLGPDQAQFRDTDWFTMTIPEVGVIEILGDAETLTAIYELSPQDCELVDVAQSASIGPCAEGSMSIVGPAGSEVWFWVGSDTFTPPADWEGNEYIYVLYTNLIVPAQNSTWTDVKAMFD